MRVDDVWGNLSRPWKRALLAAVAASRRSGADPFATKRAILDATNALEARAAAVRRCRFTALGLSA